MVHIRLCWGLGIAFSCTVGLSSLYLWKWLLSHGCHGYSLAQLIWIQRSRHSLGICGLLHLCQNRIGHWSVFQPHGVWRWIELDFMLCDHSMPLTLTATFVYFWFHGVWWYPRWPYSGEGPLVFRCLPNLHLVPSNHASITPPWLLCIWLEQMRASPFLNNTTYPTPQLISILFLQS